MSKEINELKQFKKFMLISQKKKLKQLEVSLLQLDLTKYKIIKIICIFPISPVFL